MDKKNGTAKFCFVLGVIIIVLGVIASFILGKVLEVHHSGYYYSYDEYNWVVAIGGAVGSLVLGTLFIAISEITELLEKIKINIDKMFPEDEKTEKETEVEEKSIEDAEEEFYKENPMALEKNNYYEFVSQSGNSEEPTD